MWHKRTVATVESSSREKAPFFKLAVPLKNDNSRAIKSSLIFAMSRREQQLSRRPRNVFRLFASLERRCRRRRLHRGVGSRIKQGGRPESRRVLPSVEISIRFFLHLPPSRSPSRGTHATSVSDPAGTYLPERRVVGQFDSRARDRRRTTFEKGSRFAPEMDIRARMDRRSLCDSFGLRQVVVEGKQLLCPEDVVRENGNVDTWCNSWDYCSSLFYEFSTWHVNTNCKYIVNYRIYTLIVIYCDFKFQS